MEQRMRREKLFHWPLCFLPYARDEGAAKSFPEYENGDIFLSWGEVGVRAYAGYDPAIAVAYVRRVLDRYQQDGLSFQRYLRRDQSGAGDDILAGNCMTIVGLYRDIYGIRPQWNRLCLDPHLTSELNGTKINYRLRNQPYELTLGTNQSAIAVDGFTVHAAGCIRRVKPQEINSIVFPASRTSRHWLSRGRWRRTSPWILTPGLKSIVAIAVGPSLVPVSPWPAHGGFRTETSDCLSASN